MKKAKLTLTLNKETVANLNNTEMNNVKGGKLQIGPDTAGCGGGYNGSRPSCLYTGCGYATCDNKNSCDNGVC